MTDFHANDDDPQGLANDLLPGPEIYRLYLGKLFRGPSGFYRLMRSTGSPFFKINGRWYARHSELQKYMSSDGNRKAG